MFLYAPQASEAGRVLRSIGRREWKNLGRRWRVLQRERAKAFSDAMLYGVGFVEVSADGTTRRVRPEDVYA